MKVIRPATLDSSNVVSNIPEAAPAEYNAGTTYSAGQQVSVTSGTISQVYQSLAGSNTGHTPASEPTWWALVADTYAEYSNVTTYSLGQRVINAVAGTPTHHAYESLTGSNLGNALTDATKWLDLGPTNRLAMFDSVNGTATTSSDNIAVTASLSARADGIGLFGLEAEEVHIVMETVADGVIFDETFGLISDSGITDWYAYFSEEIVYQRDLVVTDLPLNNGPDVTVEITSTSGVVECGTLVIGQTRELGGTIYGAQAGIQDFSKKTADDFGNYTIVRRAYAKRAQIKTIMDNQQVDAVFQVLADLRATPCVWVGSDTFSATWSFGFYKDYSIQIMTPNKSQLSIEIEGLT